MNLTDQEYFNYLSACGSYHIKMMKHLFTQMTILKAFVPDICLCLLEESSTGQLNDK